MLTGTCSRRRASCWGQCPRELGPASPPPTPHAALGEGPQQCPSGRQRPPWPIQVGFCLRSLGRVTAGAGTGVLGGADPRGRLFLGAAIPSMATASWEPLAARQGCVPSAPGVTPSALCQLHPGIYRDPGEHRGCLSQQGAPCTCAQREGWGLQADPGRPEEERGVLTAHRCLPVWAAGPDIAERALAGGRCDPKVSLRVCVHSLLTRLGQPQAGVTGVCRHEGQGGSCPLHGPCLAGPEFADCSSPVRAAGRAGSAEPRILQRKS